MIRLSLALAVMLSHFPGARLRFNVGVMAVVCFYIISGYLMQKSYLRFRAHGVRPIRGFYRDRLLRLMPLYWLVLGLSLVSLWLLEVPPWLPLLAQEPGLLSVLLNTLLLPANYVFPPLEIPALLPHPLIPPAWSLAAELHFYLLVPLLVGLRPGWLLVLGLLSLGVQAAAVAYDTPVFGADAFGYRYLPGVLVFFIFGLLLARSAGALVLLLWAAVAALFLVVAPAYGLLGRGYAQEQWLGALVFVPVLVLVLGAKRPRRLGFDRLLGDLAYPVFIAHFLVFLWVGQWLEVDDPLFWPASLAAVLGLSLLLSQVQRLFERRRLALRGFDSLRGGGGGGVDFVHQTLSIKRR
ncbi:MAG: acyltransferase [Lamprobacter sp.]|uniref:acyltransferase family protein n=1 Tax=Lamprobacter sp. TaxID=3100796 RepID=UPI002B25A99D|nr:acyltransferase [Lamprobacter sp.]MEA3638317.1 acyltransferase [Lamprobacter sp.]